MRRSNSGTFLKLGKMIDVTLDARDTVTDVFAGEAGALLERVFQVGDAHAH